MSENLYAELNDRSKQIFKSVVETFLETGSPSGSETVLKKGDINLSSSSIRAILSNLQKEGLLFAPHTSAGRLPTDKGMRFFVDGLLEFGRISKSEKEKDQVNNELKAVNNLVNESEDKYVNWEQKVKKISDKANKEEERIDNAKKRYENWKIGVLEEVAKMKLKKKVDPAHKIQKARESGL